VAIDDSMPFINALAQLGASDRVTVQLWREGRVMELPLEVTPR
jgi:hypothetical protein